MAPSLVSNGKVIVEASADHKSMIEKSADHKIMIEKSADHKSMIETSADDHSRKEMSHECCCPHHHEHQINSQLEKKGKKIVQLLNLIHRVPNYM